ncbi:GSU2403 family nucleotidyltransferase fold protein [Candidatus Auribacterota bacterium]
MSKAGEFESAFFDVLEDVRVYLNDLTLVGGWLAYVYARFLWNNDVVKPVTTVDIDFGFGETKAKKYSKTIFERLSSLNYTERHPRMDRIYPVVLCKAGRTPVDFITFPKIDGTVVENFIGPQIYINKIDNFEFLLKERISITIKDKKRKGSFVVNCPKPSAFLYHKAAVFADREEEYKQAKDLHYIYFMLRYAPDIDVILDEVNGYVDAGYFKGVSENLKMYFEKRSSRGCLMVEKENGPDEYIVDLRQDIFERFEKLREALK